MLDQVDPFNSISNLQIDNSEMSEDISASPSNDKLISNQLIPTKSREKFELPKRQFGGSSGPTADLDCI